MAKFIMPDESPKGKKRIANAKGNITEDKKIINSSSYTKSDIVSIPISRNIQAQVNMGGGALMAPPPFSSPIFTPQNWAQASKRKEIYNWIFSPKTTILLEDYTQKLISELNFKYKESIQDTRTGGLLFENIYSEQIVSSSGILRNPINFAVRECFDKTFYNFEVYGYWRELSISEEHPLLVIDGKLWRRKKKVEDNARFRRKQDIVSNGIKKVKLPEKYISRKEAKDVSNKDYLLMPIAKHGNIKLTENDAWLLGLFIGDGHFEHYRNGIGFTLNKKENIINLLEYILVKKSYGVCFSKKNHNSTDQAIRIRLSHQEETYKFFTKYTKGKLNSKQFTKEVFNLDEKSKLRVLAGYIDADGYYDKKDKIVANCMSEGLAEQIYQLSLSCGISCSLRKFKLDKNHAYKTNNDFYYRIFIPASEVYKLKPYLKSNKIPKNIKPVSKRELRFFYEEDGVKYIVQPIKKIEKFSHTGLGYDIQIDPERAFVASGFAASNCRFFHDSEPKVAAGIDFYSFFSMSGFTLECSSRKVRIYFEELCNKLKLNYWTKLISHEYFLLGDVFPFLEIKCKNCNGTSVLPTGKRCNHPGGSFSSLILLNPDFVEVEDGPFPDKRQIFMMPDDAMKRTIATGEPKAIYDRIPDQLKKLIASGQPIPLASTSVSHLKRAPDGYSKYGNSMIRRLFTTLHYKTKLMTANWITAERLILPIRVVKVGDADRPAGPDDIADVQNQLAAVSSDPNYTIVTHHAFDLDFQGATGKIHNISAEMEFIGKEILDGLMLNQALLNGEASCHDEETLTLTDNGFKSYNQINEKDKIGCYNPKTNALEYYHYKNKLVYNYDGEMIHFKNNEIDIMVTPNHRMYTAPRDQKEHRFIEAKNVKNRSKFIACVEDFNSINNTKSVKIGNLEIGIEDFCELAGYFVSEGFTSKEYRKNRKTYNNGRNEFYICQSKNGKAYEKIENLFRRVFKTFSYVKNHKTKEITGFRIYNPELATYFHDNFGYLSENKKIPSWMKNLNKNLLNIMLKAMIDGDGVYKIVSNKLYASYITTSPQLSQDVSEIAFKCGLVVSTRTTKAIDIENKHCNKNGYKFISKKDLYYVNISEGKGGRYPALESKDIKYRKTSIFKEQYKGKVYCFEVPPHGMFVTMRNGKITIQGNSYSSAQVGVETLIKRLESWQNELAEWIEQKIFLPESQMQGFIDDERTSDLGRTQYLYPTIKWNDLQLRDKTSKLQMYMQLHDKSLISTETLLNEFNIDYDQELIKIRTQQAMSAPGGAPGGPGGVAGGAGGGMPMDMGGGGAPPGGDMGGGMPGGGMPGGDMGGGAAPMGDMGGGMGGGGGAAPMGGATASSNLRVFKKGKKPKQEEVKFAPPKFAKLTRIEKKLFGAIEDLQLPYRVFGQYEKQVQGQRQPYLMDFAIPDLAINIEADGPFHVPEKDMERDKKLAAYGWRVIRFNEDAINEKIGTVKQVIYQNIKEAAQEKMEFYQRKKANNAEVIKTGEITKEIENNGEEDIQSETN